MIPISELDLIQIGEIIKTHGYKGELVIKLFEDFEKLKKTELLFFEIEGNIVPFFFEFNPKPYKRSGILAKFENIDSEKQVEEILHSTVYTTSDNIIHTEKDQTESLEGYSVFNHNEFIGIAGNFLDIPSNPILIVLTDSKKEVLIPLSKEFLEKIDHKGKKVFFSLPDGLININD